jgi:ADP-heptose:LPS heptosyltransferase/tRNA A-37 threonylcarbamoyl transferase component Bud32
MSEITTCVKMELTKATYKGWNILYNGDQSLLDLVDDIIQKKIEKRLIKEIKNNSRSYLLLIDFNGKPSILKNPREKNTRKWIRATTLYRQGEAFKTIQNLTKLANLGIDTNRPLLAMEKRRMGMVVDSWLVYEYKKGRPCGQEHYPDVVQNLRRFHDQGLLHGDAHIENFIQNNDTVFTIDANIKKPSLGLVSKLYEYLYLQKSAPGIEKHFDLPSNSLAYRVAKSYSQAYWSWRRFKKRKRLRKRRYLKILVMRLSSIGDIILTTPVLSAIKKKYPDATIDFVVMDAFKDAISGNTHIDNLILFDKKKYQGVSGIYRFTQTLKSIRYDLIIDLHAKIRSRLIAMFVGGKVLRYKKRALWKSLLVPLRLVRYHVDDTIVRNYFKPLEKIHVYYTGETLAFNFQARDMKQIASYQGVVVMAPGAANPTKQWPAANFAALGKMLDEPVVLIGGKSEKDTCDTICKTIGKGCINLAGKLSLKESGALISISKFIICNDSGPFHIARGTQTRAYVLFGPTDPGMFSYDNNTTLVYAQTDCSPCSLHGDKQCPRDHFDCMKLLTPELVYKKIQKDEIA